MLGVKWEQIFQANNVHIWLKNENAKKYYTNEVTNQKHRSPNKWRGNRQTTWKRIQNTDSKDDQKPWKQNGENAIIN